MGSLLKQAPALHIAQTRCYVCQQWSSVLSRLIGNRKMMVPGVGLHCFTGSAGVGPR